MNIYYEESLPDGAVDYGLLLLHGDNQCCEMWTRGGILDSLASHGHRAVAIDLPGAGRSIQPNSTTHMPGQMASLLHSVLDQLTLDKVVLVADGCSASHVINYLGRCEEAEVADIVGCVLCSPDYHQLVSDGTLDIINLNYDIPVLLLSDQHNPNIIPSLEALHDVAEASSTKAVASNEQSMLLKQPREFVETILTFLNRLQPISV